MPKNKKILQKIRDNASVAVQVVGFLVIIANLWIASKLAPISQNIEVMATQIETVKEDVRGLQGSSVTDKQWESNISDINNRLNRIERKIDAL